VAHSAPAGPPPTIQPRPSDTHPAHGRRPHDADDLRSDDEPPAEALPVAARGATDEPEQQGFDFDVTGERRELNSLINDIRARVELWRAQGYNGVTPVTRKLLLHWADPSREDRVLFCQREAAETAIFLAEVAGRHGEPDFRTRLEPYNADHNDGLRRVALKMASDR